MLKEERNIANIFFPSCSPHEEIKDGLLVGFNYEGFLFVIVAVVPLEQIPDPDKANANFTKIEVLSKMIREDRQFTAMNTYCAGELIILGVIENIEGKHALCKQD